MQSFPDSAPLHVQRGLLLGRKQQPAEARRQFERALQLDPSSVEAVGGIVAVDLSSGRREEARARVSALLSAPDAKPPAVMLAARTYAALGDLEDLGRDAATGARRRPVIPGRYGALGQLYARQGRLDAALTEFEALAARESKPVSALTLAGMILEAQGKTVAAQDRFERVMQIDPSAPVAANNLAWIYAQSDNKLDRALELAQTAQRKLPDRRRSATPSDSSITKRDWCLRRSARSDVRGESRWGTIPGFNTISAWRSRRPATRVRRPNI